MRYKCDNCDWSGLEEQAVDAEDLPERLTPGCIYTDKECPHCGALAYPYKTQGPPNRTFNRPQALAGLQAKIREWIGSYYGTPDEGLSDVQALHMARAAMVVWEFENEEFPRPSV